MPTIDEIFATMPAEASITYEELIINAASRVIRVPDAESIFGVESDTQAERKHFRCPRYVGSGLDLAGCFLRVNFRNANGEVDAYLVTDVAVDGEDVTFSWELSKKVTAYKGEVQFVVCAIMGAGLPEWNTTLAVGTVLEGLEPDTSGAEEATADVIAQLLAIVTAQTSAVQTAGENATQEAKAAVEAKGVAVVASIPADYTALSDTVGRLTRDRAAAIVCEAEGETIQVTDSSADPLIGLRVFGKSTQDGTPTPEAPVDIVSAKAPVVTISDGTDGTEGNVQTLTLSTPNSLPGIPVASGGNYTDTNGQQWIADEVDLARGVYVQNIEVTQLTTFARLTDYDVEGISLYRTSIPTQSIGGKEWARNFGLCSRMQYNNVLNANMTGFYIVHNTLMARIKDCADENVFNSLMSGATLVYARATPVETPLSTEEIEAYKALLANKPTTTVLNDAGAWMALEYAADPKAYIDNKIAALLAAK